MTGWDNRFLSCGKGLESAEQPAGIILFHNMCCIGKNSRHDANREFSQLSRPSCLTRNPVRQVQHVTQYSKRPSTALAQRHMSGCIAHQLQ